MIDVLQLARKAAEGRHAVSEGDAHSLRFDELERFAALVLEEAAKAAETQLDEAEEARSDKAFKDAYAVGSEDEAVSRGRHWMTVSTCNAVVRNCARAIRSLKERS